MMMTSVVVVSRQGGDVTSCMIRHEITGVSHTLGKQSTYVINTVVVCSHCQAWHMHNT